jgi:AcrR family transcriptional regulator
MRVTNRNHPRVNLSGSKDTESSAGRSKRGRATSSKVLQVAARLFASRGYSSVTTREVARKVGITVPSMYRYFGSKRELYLATCGAVLAHFAARYKAELEKPGLPKPRLLSFVSTFYHDLVTDPCFAKLLQREILDNDEKGLQYLTKLHFTHHFDKVTELCAELNGHDDAAQRAFSIYATTFGYHQLSAIGRAAKIPGTRWRDPVAMGKLILSESLSGIDWSKIEI